MRSLTPTSRFLNTVKGTVTSGALKGAVVHSMQTTRAPVHEKKSHHLDKNGNKRFVVGKSKIGGTEIIGG